jgi:hypothetical protein
MLIFVRIARYSEDKLCTTPQKHNVENVYTMSLKHILKERMDLLMDIIKKDVEPLTLATNEDMFR